jgi:probable F420-dependent oxidoreductase
MTRPRPFRFGIQARGPADARGWPELARRCEGLGVSTLTMPDHFDEQLGPVAGLMAAASATTTLRVGALLFCNDYRHPVVLAKEAATIDVLSDGRLEVGLGAGWMTTDYEQAGVTHDPPGRRIDRLAEALPVVKALLAGETVHHQGEHYRIDGLTGTPRSVQRPHPPILVGGGGRRVLTLAAREADIVGINIDLRAGVINERAGPNATDAATDEKVAWIREAAGDRFDDIELQVRVHMALVTDDRRGVAEAIAPTLGLDPDASLATPHALVGSVDQIADQLVERRERWGLSYIGLGVDALDQMAPVIERLAGT